MTNCAHRRLCASILILVFAALLLCPAAAGLAQYRIHTNVDAAQVYFDSVYQGQTAGGMLTVSVSASGTQYNLVEVRKTGYYTVSQSLPYVPDGSSTDMYFTLSADSGGTTGTVAVQTSPSGASVYINGIYQGIAPVTATGIRPGTYTIIAEMPGAESVTETVTITGSEYRTVTLYLGGTGAITFTSVPSAAYIELDGTIIGTTPHTATDITPGEHQIVITKNGYYNWRETIDMTGGGTRYLSATLSPVALENAIRIRSVPAGAAIYLNGIYQGETMENGYFPVTDLRIGQHIILLKLKGYDDYEETVSLSEGETVTISADLEEGGGSTTSTATPSLSAATGKLMITTSPPGAEISIDGSPAGRMTPATITSIPTGTHTICLQLAGYAAAEATVTVTAGETATLSLPLAPGTAGTPVPTKSPAPLIIPVMGLMLLLCIWLYQRDEDH
ncbi:PEGA domain-containing protein [Methanogenium organophilum]|uniref:PEGA domain-containing protein n=1 Tax=Methanogenium organophilum TaxID=2199 RepID=A0A9X9S6T1_METOG|nr:PEGA domain-containing protein [Methanogenium organophilum]WAI02460.1 PEGA domain-containing protein [Methanogenium organophilum]